LRSLRCSRLRWRQIRECALPGQCRCDETPVWATEPAGRWTDGALGEGLAHANTNHLVAGFLVQRARRAVPAKHVQGDLACAHVASELLEARQGLPPVALAAQLGIDLQVEEIRRFRRLDALLEGEPEHADVAPERL